ncbi:hypothetical protein FRIGORI9N_360023 [Frigoribacterium sp. 9N]|nr:hypothetical protein FRIGORI9N_360023 [Frigoribacterium sp. 9N]
MPSDCSTRRASRSTERDTVKRTARSSRFRMEPTVSRPSTISLPRTSTTRACRPRSRDAARPGVIDDSLIEGGGQAGGGVVPTVAHSISLIIHTNQVRPWDKTARHPSGADGRQPPRAPAHDEEVAVKRPRKDATECTSSQRPRPPPRPRAPTRS